MNPTTYSVIRPDPRWTTMAWVARARSTSGKRTVMYAIGAAVLVLVLVAGLAFTNSARVRRVTANALSLHWTNATMGTAALTRAGLAQAVTFAQLEREGIVDDTDTAFAMGELSTAMADLDELSAQGTAHDSYPSLARYMGAVEAAVDDLEDGDLATARNRIASDVEESFDELADQLDGEQTQILASIEDNTQDGETVNAWLVFIVTLAIPATAVIVYFVIARRQMRAIRERTRLELEAERSINRAKDSFIAGLSHELRTPLTSIYGFAEILSDGGVTGLEATEETARIIADEAAEMTRMVDDLLVASRLGSTGLEVELLPTNLANVIDSAIAPFRRAGLDVEWDPSTSHAMTDGARLRQVLVNLLSNAARHGGPSVGVMVSEDETSVDIEVWDDGSGVPEEMVDKLFSRYVHDADAPLLTGSIGLGLAVASRLTDILGGHIEYQRYSGRTYFTVTLPRVEPDPDPGAEDPESVADVIRSLSS